MNFLVCGWLPREIFPPYCDRKGRISAVFSAFLYVINLARNIKSIYIPTLLYRSNRDHILEPTTFSDASFAAAAAAAAAAIAAGSIYHHPAVKSRSWLKTGQYTVATKKHTSVANTPIWF